MGLSRFYDNLYINVLTYTHIYLGESKMSTKNVTLSVNSELYTKYKADAKQHKATDGIKYVIDTTL